MLSIQDLNLNELWHMDKEAMLKLLLDERAVEDDRRIESQMLFDLVRAYASLEKELKDRIKEVEHLSMTDPLTDLRNRLYLNQAMTASMERFKRYHVPFTIVLFDIDFFKKVNDTYGHDIGDRVLMSIAKISLNKTRTTDVIARWGGEEFIALLEDTGIEKGLVLAERLRKTIEETLFDQVGQITISAGIVEVALGMSCDEIIKLADNALYKAKKNGRNQVVVGGDKLLLPD